MKLINYIVDVQARHKSYQIRTYATAVFRKLTPEARQLLVDDFYRQTGLFFNIISHDLESHYLETALSAEYKLSEPLLLINIGGGSTELVILQKSNVTTRFNLDLGVGTVLKSFPYLNEAHSKHDLSEVVSAIKKNLPPAQQKTTNAIYNGGELTYMQLVGYNLKRNTAFQDKHHPYYITPRDFFRKNQDIFSSIQLSDLEDLMPNDPLWMHGARACSATAQAIVEHFAVRKLIPSDSNMVHGIAKKELRSAVLSGSYRKHLNYIESVKRKLSSRGAEVLSPRFSKPKNPGEEFIVFEGEDGLSPLELERYHLEKIKHADALIVCSPKGYVGASALIEIGYANALGKRIIFTEKPSEYLLKQLPAEIGL